MSRKRISILDMLVHIYYSLRVLLPSRKLLERKNEVEISFLELT